MTPVVEAFLVAFCIGLLIGVAAACAYLGNWTDILADRRRKARGWRG